MALRLKSVSALSILGLVVAVSACTNKSNDAANTGSATTTSGDAAATGAAPDTTTQDPNAAQTPAAGTTGTTSGS